MQTRNAVEGCITFENSPNPPSVKMRGATAEYPGKIEAGGKGLASTCPVSRVWMIERGNFLCAGYASTRGYASKLRLRNDNQKTKITDEYSIPTYSSNTTYNSNTT